MTLAGERCVACRRDSLPVADREIAELHSQVSDWQLTEKDGVKRLERTFRFRGFDSGLAFTMRVGEAAEAEGHHPRITVAWGEVAVQWWTHTIRGLHRNDFVMAAKTDQLYGRASPEDA